MPHVRPLTKPEVFIIESLDIRDEENRKEGEIIYRSLKMSGKDPIYHYIRTMKEFRHFMGDFKNSKYRYLHISCHGNNNMISTTFDYMDNVGFSDIVGKPLNKRRLFMSTCKATTEELARNVFAKGNCLSVAGPVSEIRFDDSTILWTSFYHLMFKENSKSMSNQSLIQNMTRVASMIGEPMRVITSSGKNSIAKTWIVPGSDATNEDK